MIAEQKTIWKYAFIGRHIMLEMPIGAQFVHVNIQNGIVMGWAIVDPNMALTEERHFRRDGTGFQRAGELGTYIGTAHDGEYVWHIFEVTEQVRRYDDEEENKKSKLGEKAFTTRERLQENL